MNPALLLMGVYIVVTGILQFVGFLICRLVEMFDPTVGLFAFVIVYLGMFWVGWPIAVKLSEILFPGVKAASIKA